MCKSTNHFVIWDGFAFSPYQMWFNGVSFGRKDCQLIQFILTIRIEGKGLKVVTIEIIEIVTTIIVTMFKCCNNLNML